VIASTETLATLEFDRLRDLIAQRAASDVGREEIAALKPLSDPVKIDQILRPVMETLDIIRFDDPFSIGRVPDIRPILEATSIPGAVLGVSELVAVGQVLTACHRLHRYIDDRSDKYPSLVRLIYALSTYPDLSKTLDASLDAGSETVRDGASSELRRIRRGMESIRSEIRQRVDGILSGLNDTIIQDRLVTLRGGRFVIPVRENQKHRVEGLIHDQSSSGATLFIEPIQTVEMNNRLRQLELAERAEIERILRELTAQVADIRIELRQNLDILGRFDAAYAKASFAQEIDAVEPVFSKRTLRLKAARHPLLAVRLAREDRPNELIPLDLEMGTDEERTLIITGPNAGGKTVAIKTVGLLAAMAQSGLPIPAAPKSELPLFDSFFADIGDAQSIENDLSTFSSHVRNLEGICSNAGRDSLVLLDEIGSSTDPDQGSALAMAILRELTRRGTLTIATTHHGSVKAFAHEEAGVMNGSMAFDTETLQPSFRLRLHIPGSSYAFEIARRLGIPGPIVDEAERIAGSDVGRVESLIAELDAEHHRFREQADAAERSKAEAEETQADYEVRLRDVELRERELRRTGEREARRVLDEANALVERTVEDIRRRQADRSAIRDAHSQLSAARQSIDRSLEAAEKPMKPQSVSEGDTVWVRRLDKVGVVSSYNEDAGRISVSIGNLRVDVSPTEIELRQKATGGKTTSDKVTITGRSGGRDISIDLDVRGLNFEDASEFVDKHLDDLYLARMQTGAIIHGKGTGVLRRKLGDFLKQHPLVRTQRLGGQGEGGNGVTIVELDIED